MRALVVVAVEGGTPPRVYAIRPDRLVDDVMTLRGRLRMYAYNHQWFHTQETAYPQTNIQSFLDGMEFESPTFYL